MINIKNLGPNKIKIDEKSYKSIIIYYIVNVTDNNLIYIKFSSVNPLYIIIHKINRYIKYNGNKYLTLVPTDQTKEALGKYKELYTRVRDLVKSKT